MGDQDRLAATVANVVIVGAGFAGLETAKALAGAPVAITIIDKQNHHCFQPLLYQVATAALSPADIAWPIRGIVSRQRNARVVMAEVIGVDRAARQVCTDIDLTFPYDILVLATGSTHSYFGHDDWAGWAPGLKRIEDAVRIRRRLLRGFEEAEVVRDEREQRRLMTFIVIGGGPTGVEMAGAIAEISRYALARDFRRINPRLARIVLIEAGPRLLPQFPENLSHYAQQQLARMGVEVLTGVTVTGCGPDGVDTDSKGHIAGGTLIWAAGVRASEAAAWLDAARDAAGRVKVENDLTIPGDRAIFVIGDTARVVQDGRPVPGLAPAAKQMGRYVAKVIAARVSGQAVPPPFRYHHAGDLATIGRRAAIVSIAGFKLKGALAWLFWGLAHIYYLIGTRNRLAVALNWIWDYLTFQRGARLISDYRPPPSPT